MEQHDHLELGWQQKLRMPLSILFLLVLNSTLVSNVQAQAQFVTVKVLIERAVYAGCNDRFTPPDIYFKVRINTAQRNNRNKNIESHFRPFRVDQEFSLAVNFSLGTIPITIEQWDADSGLDGDDDKCDIKAGSGNDLNLRINLVDNCQVSGDVSGSCDTTILPPTGPFIEFKISVEERPRTPGLAIRCLHAPIWPQPGDTVGIIAQALDGNGNPITGQPVTNVEIWADNTTAPIKATATTPGLMGKSALATIHTPASGADQFMYRCRAEDKNAAGVTEKVSTNWRRVQIGQPADGKRAVGIINMGFSNNRVDIVFIADKTDYPGGANDPQFLPDVSTVIRNAYYAGSSLSQAAGLLFLTNQDTINFWIALDTGDATGTALQCGRLKPPDNWNRDYTFADAGAIIHTEVFRDCALPGRKIFSTLPGNAGLVLHETGHVPFGLADEYCCDGGYVMPKKNPSPDDLPNVYHKQGVCQMDQLSFGVTDACEQISGNACVGGANPRLSCKPDSMGQDPARCGMGIPCSQTFLPNVFRLDPLSTITNDLMVNNGAPQGADQRRINGFFNTCRLSNGDC